jgi:hypothetical protein
VTIQRDAYGQVQDSYIWESQPGYNGNWGVLFTGLFGTGEKRALLRFDLGFLPEEANILSATFGIRLARTGSGEAVNFHAITEPWLESEPTWRTFAESYDPAVASSFTPVGGWATADVTGLATTWAGDPATNNGFMLISPSNTLDAYRSSEHGIIGERPWLEVCYVPGSVQLQIPAVTKVATAEEDMLVLERGIGMR